MKRAFGVLLVIAAVAGSAGCGGSAPAPGAEAATETVGFFAPPPGSFLGVLPCADCEGIDHRLDLLDDGTFILRTVYRGRSDEAFYDIGRYEWGADQTLTLRGANESRWRWDLGRGAELRRLDRDGRPIDSELDYALRSTAGLEPMEPRLNLRGTFWYVADAALLTECRTGWRMPVAPTGANLALERAYLDAKPEMGQEMLVELDARLAWLPPMEGQGLVRTVEPLEFLRIGPDESCDGVLASPALRNTCWKMACLDMQGQDRRFTAALAEATRWRIDDQYLLLLDGNGKVRARFQAMALR